jgi:N,N'-diacetyllegionaminate synthase
MMLFVAEIGMNHDGNFDLAYELIRQAKFAGADIAKFQFGWRDKLGEINQIDLGRAKQLKEWCQYLEIEMLASLITEDALELARAINLPRYKIASRTVAEKPGLCREILSDGKETFVSLGMWDAPEWPFGPPSNRLHYIYCRSKYPTYPHDLLDFPANFSPEAFYGYSDHCHGISACLVAVGRGAQFIEKHFTLNKNSQVIRDHTLSAIPDEFAELTRIGGEINRLAKALNIP